MSKQTENAKNACTASGQTGELVYIDVSLIHPHPDNPRKNLGDLSELAESIKVNGILQNLTVVPMISATSGEGYCPSCALYLPSSPTMCRDDHKDRAPCKYWQDAGRYTVVIGHRRLAAAKLAGVEKVPCMVSDMDRAEQVRTMLMENIQREDLTVYEQAQGFQMMLNLGDSIEDVASKTGFSKTTIRRRVKLLDLDPDKFKASEARGATLFDYMELDKIEDPARKNDVLDKIGTPDFNNVLRRTIQEEEAAKLLAGYEVEVSRWAKKAEQGEFSFSSYESVKSYYVYSKKEEVMIPDDLDSREYIYTSSKYSVSVYRLRLKADEDTRAAEIAERERKEEERKAQVVNLKVATERTASLRQDFVDSLSATAIKKHMTDIVAMVVVTAYEWDISAGDGTLEALGLGTDGEDFELTPEVVAEAIKCPEKALLQMLYLSMEDEDGYFNSYRGEYHENERLDVLYDFLEKLGYEMSDEEKALKNGTHELFRVEVKNC